MNKKSLKRLFWSVLFIAGFANAESLSKLFAALDSPSGMTLDAQYYVTFKVDEDGWIETDEDGMPLIKKQSTDSKWAVQSGTKNGTTPRKGGSCVYSTIAKGKDYDAHAARLVFKVNGIGLLEFSYKTSTEPARDGLNVYVDGEQYLDFSSASGYGDEVDWGYTDDDDKNERGREAITVMGAYDHEIIFEFYRGEPEYDWSTDKYLPAGPVKPVKPSKSEDAGGDEELYKELLAMYNEELADYEEALKNFHNCVWLDNFVWTPIIPYLNLSKSEEDSLDKCTIDVDTNGFDIGYSVRYTTSGADPKYGNSEEYVPSLEETGIKVDKSCTLKAGLFDGSRIAPNPGIVSLDVTVKASAPSITLSDKSSEEAVVLEMTKSYSSNIIRYTTDGTEPDASSTEYDPKTGVVVTESCIVKAICTRDGVTPSDVVSYEVEKIDPPTISVYSVADDVRYNDVKVIGNTETAFLECKGSDNATIFYSLDGGKSFDVYHSPVELTDLNNSVVVYQSQSGKSASDKVSTSVNKADMQFPFYPSKAFYVDNSLEDGWNIVTIPVTFCKPSEKELLSKYKFYEYNVESSSFSKATALKEGRGYWIFWDRKKYGSNYEKLMDLYGSALLTKLEAENGWSMIGSTDKITTPPAGKAWRFENGKYIFNVDGKFEKGRGYMFYK